MTKVKTVTHYTTQDIKKAITKQGVKNETLRVFIIGYVTDGNREPFDADEVYYTVSVATFDHDFDMEVIETTSLAKAKQRQDQLYNSLHGYRGNTTKLIEHNESDGLYSDY